MLSIRRVMLHIGPLDSVACLKPIVSDLTNIDEIGPSMGSKLKAAVHRNSSLGVSSSSPTRHHMENLILVQDDGSARFMTVMNPNRLIF